MIEINVKDLNENVTELNNIILSYQESDLNLFNMMKNLTLFWQDNHAKIFFDQLEKEQISRSQLIKEIQKRKDIYQYIYNEYHHFGNKIKCNLDAKDVVINKIDNCIQKTKEIIELFNQIDITKNYKGREKIIKDREKMVNILTDYENSKIEIKKFFDQIEKIEQEINLKKENLDNVKIDDYSGA